MINASESHLSQLFAVFSFEPSPVKFVFTIVPLRRNSEVWPGRCIVSASIGLEPCIVIDERGLVLVCVWLRAELSTAVLVSGASSVCTE